MNRSKGTTPTKRQVESGYYKLVGGQWYRKCTGPSHEEPVFLPATEKYFYKRKVPKSREGEFYSRCRLCTNWTKLKLPEEEKGSLRGFIEVTKAYPFFHEAAAKIGLLELAHRTGISRDSLSLVLNRRQAFVTKRHLRLVMLELISIRRKKEHSINNYARWRVDKRINGTRPVCVECGTAISSEEGFGTLGCKTCSTRRSKRRGRARIADQAGSLPGGV